MTDLLEPPPAGSPDDAEGPPAGEGRREDGTREPQGSSGARLALVALGAVAIGALGGWSWIVIIVAIVAMIFMHELGHYITARWAGMKVTEFFIGFGPRLWSFTRGETEYGFKAIPAGAYVKILGMHNIDDGVDPADEPRTYRQQSYGRRMSVAVAGSTMHFLMAFAMLFVIFAVYGEQDAEKATTWTIESVDAEAGQIESLRALDAEGNAEYIALLESGSTPAAEAGLRPGDRITTIDGVDLEIYRDLKDVVAARPGETVEIVYVRDGETRSTELDLATITDGSTSAGRLGIASDVSAPKLSIAAAGGESVRQFGTITAESVKALGRFFSPSGLSGFAEQTRTATDDDPSPVQVGSLSSADEGAENRIISIYGAARIGAAATEAGLAPLLQLLVVLNIFIGVFNLVPLLPLDGGHVAVGTYEKVRELQTGRRRYFADVNKLIPLTTVVIMVLVTIGLMALYLDIANPVI